MRGGTIAAISGLAFAAAPQSVDAATPVGELVSVDCEQVVGWAQDPDQPLNPTTVHLSFGGPAGARGASSIVRPADTELPIGCDPAQCDHGFVSTLPMSLLDGAPHDVHAYGVDLTGEPEAELALSPGMFTCPAPPVIGGDKRHVVSPEILAAWGFSIFFDRLVVEDALLAALPDATPIDAAPMLAVADTSDPTVWWIDGSWRRFVDPEHAAAWRFDLATVVEMPVAMLAAIPEGTPLPPRPILLQGTDAMVYLFDDHQCADGDPDPVCQPEPEDPTTGGDDGDGSGGGGESGEDGAGTSDGTGGGIGTGGEALPDQMDGDDAGCGCRTTASPRGLGLALGLCLLALRRRRVTTSRREG